MPNENPYSTPEADVHVEETGAVLASRWARLGGAIIDGIIIAILIVPLMFAFGMVDRAMAGTNTFADAIIGIFIGLIVFTVLNGYLLANSGQTIAKRLLGMRIVSVADGSILPLPKIIGLRYVPLYVVGQIPLIGGILGLINALFIFRGDKRCVHDLIAGTHVIKA